MCLLHRVELSASRAFHCVELMLCACACVRACACVHACACARVYVATPVYVHEFEPVCCVV